MANRPTAELAIKRAANFDAVLANRVLQWVVSVLQTGDSEDKQFASKIGKVDVEKDVHTPLRDGVILCRLVNICRPGSVKKIETSSISFKQMANISSFLAVCGPEAIGVSDVDLFKTPDLLDGTNIPQVINGIDAFVRKLLKSGRSNLPNYGVPESEPNKREFTEEQLRARQSEIGLQMGINKGAKHSNVSVGGAKQLADTD